MANLINNDLEKSTIILLSSHRMGKVKVNLSILSNNNIHTISVLHGSFSNEELLQLRGLSCLRTFKYHEIVSSKEFLDVLLVNNL